ncbi:MAG: hypothetical protein AB9882_11870 [Ignavibacteriaceae bacterium]
MSKIVDVKKTVVKFLKENLDSSDVTVIKIEKVNEIWNVVAEVYEDDSFLKSMNLPPKKARLFYSLKVDENLEILSYERVSSSEGMDSAS